MPIKRLRCGFNSNSLWSQSGYGQQMAELMPYIVEEGYPLMNIDYFGLDTGKLIINGIVHYGKINHIFGSDAMWLHGNDFKVDVMFALLDQWVLNPEDLAKVNRYIPLTPIDADPAPKVVIDKLRYAYRIITYSKFGYEQVKKNGLYSTYIPHTVNTEIFKPKDKAQAKKESGLPADCFLVGMVAANKDNPPRKSFQEVMDAFKEFLKKEPKALLYIHTNPDFPGGFPLKQYSQFIGIGSKVIYPDTYRMNYQTGKEQMAAIYNNFDVLLNPSQSEGFGVPIIESQSCGVIAIVNNYVSMPELIIPGKTGFLVDVVHKRFSGMGSYFGVPSPQGIYNALIDAHKADREVMGEAARKWIVENFDTKMIFNTLWRPFLQKLEDEIYPSLDTPEKKVDNITVDKKATS